MAMTVALNRLDEHFLTLDREAEPWNVHFEVQTGEQLDGERLAQAIPSAMARHPLARASLLPSQAYERSYRWQIADGPPIPLTIAYCADEDALDGARVALAGARPPLPAPRRPAAPPPSAGLLAPGPAGDTLVLSLHHAAGDGVAAARLMRSI